MKLFCLLAPAFLAFSLSRAPAAEAPAAGTLLTQASAAFSQGKREEAVALATRAIAAEPENFRARVLRGRMHEETGQHEKALADYEEALRLNPKETPLYQHRGVEHFRLGHMPESVADFDRFIAAMPAQAPHHWQRGIALYYAGRYAEGRKQFESHQTVNSNDVENAVWHFLCVARQSDVKTARAALIPIQGDPRVPMTQIHALFAGTLTPADMLAAAQAGSPSAGQLDDRLFYAHLYLGLYYEAAGNAPKAREHIFKAAEDFKAAGYMGDVARVHAAILRKQAK